MSIIYVVLIYIKEIIYNISKFWWILHLLSVSKTLKPSDAFYSVRAIFIQLPTDSGWYPLSGPIPARSEIKNVCRFSVFLFHDCIALMQVWRSKISTLLKGWKRLEMFQIWQASFISYGYILFQRGRYPIYNYLANSFHPTFLYSP